MKLIFLTISFLQVSASFFDDFQGAMSSVEDSFEKLLTDVVSDVKVTIDCAILAVEHVLSLGGLFGNDPSEYEKRCKGEIKSAVTSEAVDVTKPDDITPSYSVSVNEIINKSSITDEINTSILNINKTICNVIDKNDAKAKLENAKNVLKNETDRLTEVSGILKKELTKLSQDVKNKFNFNSNDSSFKNVWNEMKILHNVEKSNDKGGSTAKEVGIILDEVLDVLQVNKNSSSSDDDKIKEIMTDLEKDTNETVTSVDVEKQFLEWENEYIMSNQNGSNDTLEDKLNFKGISERTFERAPKTSNNESKIENEPSDGELDFDEDESFFDSMVDDVSDKEQADRAKSIIERSKFSQALFDKYLNRDDQENNVFNSTDFDFY